MKTEENLHDLENQTVQKNLIGKVATAAVLEEKSAHDADPFNPANVPPEYVKAWEECVNMVIGTILFKLNRRGIVVTNRELIKFIQSGKSVDAVKTSVGTEYRVVKVVKGE